MILQGLVTSDSSANACNSHATGDSYVAGDSHVQTDSNGPTDSKGSPYVNQKNQGYKVRVGVEHSPSPG